MPCKKSQFETCLNICQLRDKFAYGVYLIPLKASPLGLGLAISNYEAGFQMKKAIGLLFLLSVVVNCSLRKRGLETPVPNEQIQSKSFFFENGDTEKPKRFLLGVAPIQTDADGEEWETFLAQDALHVNIEFQVTADKLIGLQVNPSFPNDRSKWSKVLEIDILKHFYYEYRKDEYGRDTRELIENDQRSHYSRRTYMRLNLSSIRFFVDRWGSSYFSKSSQVLSADNEEWDLKKSFLGFNINERTTFSYGVFARNSQIVNVTRRVNILAFQSDKSFKATPYHVDNAKYFNILHTVSRQIEEGKSIDKQVMKAAKWDLSKPMDIYLDGVPEKYVSLFEDTIDAWETSLRNIGAIQSRKKTFNIRTDYPSKYPFDLRYPTIHWVDSKRTSLYSPLGIALNNADVETGKMLAANVIIYGGMMEVLINRYFNPSLVKSSEISVSSESLLPEVQFLTPNLPKTFTVPGAATRPGFNIDTEYLKLDALDRSPLAPMLQAKVQSFLQNNSMLELLDLGMFAPRKENQMFQFFSQSQKEIMERDVFERGATNLADHHDRTFAHVSSMWSGGLAFAESAGYSKVTQRTALRSLIRNVLLHELGHFLGLGHQFKGTLVPEYGTLPKAFTNHSDNLKNTKSLFAKAMPSKAIEECRIRKNKIEDLNENNNQTATQSVDCVSEYIPTNYSSIMDYLNGRMEVILAEKDVVPGPHDELVLRYIYNGEIATFNKAQDRFEFFKHADILEDKTGFVPSRIHGNPVAYFPACNDYDASLLKDPFCNRWDSGTRAEDIAASYIHNIDDNITNILFNFSDTSEVSAATAENRLWSQSIEVFSHLRTFYEELRIRLLNTPFDANANDGVSMWQVLKENEEALFQFSSACEMKVEQIRNQTLKVIMADKLIKDLCVASIKTLNATKKYVALPPIDYTILADDRVMQGGYVAGEGLTQWSTYVNGKSVVLTNRPLKVISLFNASTSIPFMLYGGSFMNNIFYNKEENRFLYRTLFPNEITDITATTVNKNLMFANEAQNSLGRESKTIIGSTILSLAYFNWAMNEGSYAGNEKSRLTLNYNDILQNQTSFDFSYGALLIKVQPQNDPGAEADRFKKFTVELYDFSNNKTIKIEDFYILPEGRVIARNGNMFLFPVTKIRFYSETEAYALVYKIGYDELRETDPLIDKSIKTHLTDTHKRIVDNCTIGDGVTGLSGFFGGAADSTFSGFRIMQGIHKDDNKTPRFEFEKSLRDEFAKYEAYVKKKNPKSVGLMQTRCEEALKGIGMISSVAGMLNGYWLGITNDYVER